MRRSDAHIARGLATPACKPSSHNARETITAAHWKKKRSHKPARHSHEKPNTNAPAQEPTPPPSSAAPQTVRNPRNKHPRGSARHSKTSACAEAPPRAANQTTRNERAAQKASAPKAENATPRYAGQKQFTGRTPTAKASDLAPSASHNPTESPDRFNRDDTGASPDAIRKV